MSLQKEPFYKMTKISDLSKVMKNSPIQIIGIVKNYSSAEKKLILDDLTGVHTIFVPDKIAPIKYQDGMVVRIFGKWDGIKLSLIDQILEWNIEPDKIPLVHTNEE